MLVSRNKYTTISDFPNFLKKNGYELF